MNNCGACHWKHERCVFRTDRGYCTALSNTDFADNVCHFRKHSAEGVNIYDVTKSMERTSKV